ncbi:hypothetical protein GCM10010339_62820 [Streptomyces alanosinicus]|uniref:Uncharacterized protein n=1 Tax=Streptomyces alanosinicus TaxID=68171 RepID=A0A919D5F9_9ACTN|nr:hypothetical protein GCM10010339_62820 [Streptomyces alanosinicus]
MTVRRRTATKITKCGLGGEGVGSRQARLGRVRALPERPAKSSDIVTAVKWVRETSPRTALHLVQSALTYVSTDENGPALEHVCRCLRHSLTQSGGPYREWTDEVDRRRGRSLRQRRHDRSLTQTRGPARLWDGEGPFLREAAGEERPFGARLRHARVGGRALRRRSARTPEAEGHFTG